MGTGGKGFLSYAATVILQSVRSGYLYGFDIIDITGLPGGTVYPALRRLEEAGYLTSKWEHPKISQSEPRPARKYYELTRTGREVLAEPLLERLMGEFRPELMDLGVIAHPE